MCCRHHDFASQCLGPQTLWGRLLLPGHSAIPQAVPTDCAKVPADHGGEGLGAPLTILGLKGGLIFFCSSRTQSISLKNGCCLMASSPFCAATQPRRLWGFLVMNCGRKTRGDYRRSLPSMVRGGYLPHHFLYLHTKGLTLRLFYS